LHVQSEIRVSVPSVVRVDQVNQVLLNSDLFKYRERAKTLEFYFPAFSSTLRYDPDFTIIDSNNAVAPQAADPKTDFIVAVSVGAVFGILLVILVAVLAVFLYRRKRRLAQQEETWRGIRYDVGMSANRGSRSPPIATALTNPNANTIGTKSESSSTPRPAAAAELTEEVAKGLHAPGNGLRSSAPPTYFQHSSAPPAVSPSNPPPSPRIFSRPPLIPRKSDLLSASSSEQSGARSDISEYS